MIIVHLIVSYPKVILRLFLFHLFVCLFVLVQTYHFESIPDPGFAGLEVLTSKLDIGHKSPIEL